MNKETELKRQSLLSLINKTETNNDVSNEEDDIVIKPRDLLK